MANKNIKTLFNISQVIQIRKSNPLINLIMNGYFLLHPIYLTVDFFNLLIYKFRVVTDHFC